MQISSIILKISLILLFTPNDTFALFKIIKNLNPFKIVEKLIDLADCDTCKTTVPPPTTVSTTFSRTIPVQEIIFNLPSRIQTFFNPDDVAAKENYIMSPISAGILLGELLIGTYQWHHNIIAKMMDLSTNTKGPESLIDERVHHAFYHYKLLTMQKRIQSNEENNVVKLDNGLFFKQIFQLNNVFLNKIRRFYEAEIIPLSKSALFDDSTNPIEIWSSKNMKISLTNYNITKLINPKIESILVNNFVFNQTWKFPLEQSKKKETFTIAPYETIDIKYLVGKIKSAVYVETEEYRLVAVPLGSRDTKLYILLPEGSTFTIYNIRQFSESLGNFGQIIQYKIKHSPLKDVELKLPNIFTQFVEFDFSKPLLNFINDESDLMGILKNDGIALNSAATDLNINKVVQYMYFSITNKEEKIEPEVQIVNQEGEKVIQHKINTTEIHMDYENTYHFEHSYDPNEKLPPDVRSRNASADLNKRLRREIKDSEPDDDTIKFEVNRPFVFIIMDEITNMVLVWGSISDPQKLE